MLAEPCRCAPVIPPCSSHRPQRPDIDGNVFAQEQLIQRRIHQIQDREVIVRGDMGVNNGAALRGMRPNLEGRLRKGGGNGRADLRYSLLDRGILRLMAARLHLCCSSMAWTKCWAALRTRHATRALTAEGVSSAFSRTSMVSRRIRRSVTGYRLRRAINSPLS